MKLKKNERIIKKGAVVASVGAGSGVLYLTNKRLLLEYYGVIPVNPSEFEIPLNELTGVNKQPGLPSWLQSGVILEYSHGGKPDSILFTARDAYFVWDNARIANDWIAQIQNSIKKS